MKAAKMKQITMGTVNARSTADGITSSAIMASGYIMAENAPTGYA